MKGYLKLLIGLFFVSILTGCLAEDYDVGVPTAHLYIGDEIDSVQLKEATIDWVTISENVHQSIDDVEEFGLKQDEIIVSANEKASFDFEENEKNGGDIWTDPTITATLLKGEQRIELKMNEYRDFYFPTTKGNYVLEVTFSSSAGTAQYVGNILIQ